MCNLCYELNAYFIKWHIINSIFIDLNIYKIIFIMKQSFYSLIADFLS